MENLKTTKTGDFIICNNYLVKVLVNNSSAEFVQIIYDPLNYIVEKYKLKQPTPFRVGAKMEITSFCKQYLIDQSIIVKSSTHQQYVYVWGWPGFLNRNIDSNYYFLQKKDEQWCKKYYHPLLHDTICQINKELI